jgi:hypothetical protein
MACRKCGSDWVTALGCDCKTCPHCCKQQRHKARSEGRWVEPTAEKVCEECGAKFTAVGLHDIKLRVLCHNPQCKKSRGKKTRAASHARRAVGVFVLPREPKNKRFCKFSKCGKELARKDQKEYCDRVCYFAAIDAGEQQFRGRVRDEWAGLVDWAYEWDAHRPEWMECEACSKKVERQSSMQRVCSEKCRYRLEKPLHQNCCDCGSELNADTRYVKRCDACKRKSRNHWKRIAGKTPRKRCRRHGVPCDPAIKSRDVFERDGYKCQLCGCKCLAKFKVVNDMPHPLSPTVDHIIAISLGIKGHTWDNVQCACWKCNVAKGAQAKGQMRLAGC